MRTPIKLVALIGALVVALAEPASAQLNRPPDIGRRHVLLPPAAQAAAGAATAFDPTHCTTGDLTLSNSNTTITRTGGGNTNDWCYTVSPGSAGQKIYVETTWTAWSFQILAGFGVDNTLTNDRSAGGGATPSKGATMGPGGTLVDVDSVDSGAGLLASAVTAGDTVDFALDSTAHKIWARKNNGAWTGGGDPATGTGGLSVATTPNSQYYFFYGADGTLNDSMADRFSSASWIHTPPSGYSQINGP